MNTDLPWNLLIEHAQDAVDGATRRLAAAQRRTHDAQAQLDTLQTYRDEYLAKQDACARNGVTVATLDNQRRFIDRLDLALDQQREALRQAQHHLDHCQQLWQADQRKLKSFDTLAERQRVAHEKRRALHEQKAADESATQRFLALARMA